MKLEKTRKYAMEKSMIFSKFISEEGLKIPEE